MRFSEKEFDFGYAPQSSSISHAFWIYSVGDDTLKILKVTPGCGCTKAPIEKTVLPVGDSTKLEVIFDTRHYAWQVKKTPRIETNIGKPDQIVTIVTNVLIRSDTTFPIIIKPYKLDLSQFGQKARDHMNFSIKNVSDKTLKPRLISDTGPVADVELPDSIEPGESASGRISLTEEGLSKEFERSFTIELDDGAQTRFTVPVKRSIINTGTPQVSDETKSSE